MTGSVVDITCPTGASCTSAPDSAALGATTWAGVYSTTCGTAAECATAYATYLQKFYGACQANSGCSQAWELATSFNDYQEKITTFLTTATDQGFTTASANLFVNLVDGWAWQKCNHALTDAYKFVTSNGAIVPVGDGDPELSILAAKNGTTIYDWKGDAFVQSFATGQTLLMSAGEKLFIPSDQAQASQQNLITSAQAFSPASTTQWWNTNGGPNYATLLSLVVIAGVVLVAAGYAVKRRRGRAGQGARAVLEYPFPGPAQGSALTTSQLACPSCGALAAPGAAFCGTCGSSLSQGVVCPHCGASNPSGAKFCQACSKRI
ncbi:MAG: zinc ribbon domain-containing protein [Thaumarchaeota archaeon]|nr:zinc ribbon domain-containing protein [Nitrososphaerota archaeon]